MPNSHKQTKKGISARVEPDHHRSLHDLAKLNGTDFAGLMVKLARGEPLVYPDGRSVWDVISGTNKDHNK